MSAENAKEYQHRTGCSWREALEATEEDCEINVSKSIAETQELNKVSSIGDAPIQKEGQISLEDLGLGIDLGIERSKKQEDNIRQMGRLATSEDYDIAADSINPDLDLDEDGSLVDPYEDVSDEDSKKAIKLMREKELSAETEPNLFVDVNISSNHNDSLMNPRFLVSLENDFDARLDKSIGWSEFCKKRGYDPDKLEK